MAEVLQEKQKKGFELDRKKKRLLFYLSIVILPTIQFCILYIYVNFNTIILGFKSYEIIPGQLGYKVGFAGLENFKVAWQVLTSESAMLKNSLLLFVWNLLIGTTLALVFSFYIYKKFPCSTVFRVLLFMPQIVSGLILGLLFKYVVGEVYTALFSQEFGLLENPATKFGTVLFYEIWVGFGVNVIMYTGAMSGINESVVESAHLDGAGLIQEFVYITLPLIYNTLSTFIIVQVSSIFTAQMHLYTLFGTGANELSTFGYYLYLQALQSDVVVTKTGYLSYPQLSALGFIISCIMIPIVLGMRKLMEKVGPSTD